MSSTTRPWVKFVQAYSYTGVYINPEFVASVQRHSVCATKWTVIVCGNETFTVLEPIETVLEKLGIEE